MNNTLGSRISERLESCGFTQRDLAQIVGITEASVCRYVKDERVPKGPVLVSIAKALHTTTDYLMGHNEETDPELVYYQTQRAIAMNAQKWTQKQKLDLINVMLAENAM